MKKTLSIVLVLVMIFSIFIPIYVNAVRTEQSKTEELFNKSVVVFQPFNTLDENKIKEFVTKDMLSKIVYDLFIEGIKKNDELNTKLGDGKQLKEIIARFITDDNVSVVLSELKANKPIKSTLILGEYIKNVEKLFDKDWDYIVNDDFRKSTQSIISMLSGSIEKTEEIKITDIETYWGKDEIQAMIGLGVVNGYPDKTFRPNASITRAEFAKIIVTALKLENVIYKGGFSDISIGQWYANNVATMVKNELALGYPDGTFNPNGDITRNEMAAILSKVLKLELSEEEQAVLISTLEDLKLIPDWAKVSVAAVIKAELVKVGTDNNYNPLNKATRGEAASAIYRLIKLKEKDCNT